MAIKVIYFDFFGVLSTTAYMQAFEHFIPEEEREAWFAKLDILDIGDISEKDLVKEISLKSKISEKEVWDFVCNAPKLNQKLLSFIKDELKQKYKIGLLTNAPKSLIERVMQDELKIFDVAIISSEVRMIKPNRNIFEYAISQTGNAPEEIILVDDSLRNVKAAGECGIKTIRYVDFNSFERELKKH